nr:hypothetical protein [Tanacetum cinerariifolium]
MSSDEASYGVTYTSISSDYEEPSDAGPEYLEYLASSDVEIPIEDQPYAAAAPSPITLSLSYIADSDPEKDLEDESEDEPTDYLDEEDEHLALADSTAVSPVVDHVPSPKETDPFETDESATTPPPLAYRTTDRMSIRSQAPILFPPEAEVARLLSIPIPPPSPLTLLSSPLPQIPSPPTHTSLTYAEAHLGFRAARIQLRNTSPPPLPSPPLPPPSSPLLYHQLIIGRKFPRLTYHLRRGYVRYGITNTWDELMDAIQEGAPTTLEGVNARATELAETHERDTQDLYAHMEDAQDS